MCLDEPKLSIWSGKNQDLQFVEKITYRDLKHPTPMCRSQNSTPKQKKIARKKESVWGRYHCLKITSLIIFPKFPLSRLQKSNDSRFHLRCPILVKQKSIWGFFDLLNVMQISNLHQQVPIFTCKKSLLWPNGQKKIEK